MGRLLRTSLTPPACSVTTVPDTLPSSPILHMLMLLSHLPGAAHTRGQLLTALSSCSCQLCWRAGTARAQGEADLVWGIWGKWPLSCVLSCVLCPVPCAVSCALCPARRRGCPSCCQGNLGSGHRGFRKVLYSLQELFPPAPGLAEGGTHPKGMPLTQKWGCHLSCLPSTRMGTCEVREQVPWR